MVLVPDAGACPILGQFQLANQRHVIGFGHGMAFDHAVDGGRVFAAMQRLQALMLNYQQ